MTKRKIRDPEQIGPTTGLDPVLNINIWNIRKRFLRIYAAALGWAGVALDERTFSAFVDAIHEELPKADKDALSASCAHIIGVPLNRGIVAQLCWRLAANREPLERGEPVYPWVGQDIDQYAAVQIIDAAPENLSLRVLTGKAAGAAIDVRVRLSSAGRLFKTLGFTKPARGLAFTMTRIHDLIRMVFICRLIPAAGPSRLAIWHMSYKITTTMLKYNRALLRARRTLPRSCNKTADYCAVCENRLCPAYGYLFIDC